MPRAVGVLSLFSILLQFPNVNLVAANVYAQPIEAIK
jgi:hypothetical protein